MQAIWVDTPGDALVLRETAMPRLAVDEVLVRVHATAVNRADLLQRQGHYAPPVGASPILGLEFAGTIVDVGQAKTPFKVGDRVMGIVSGGAYADFVAVPAAQLLPIPAHMDFAQAAALPEAFVTANEALFELGELRTSECLLLHAATSGVGTAALQLAKLQGVSVIALARDDAKLAKIQRFHPKLSINYEKEDWVTCIKAAGLAEKIDVIADFIGAAYMAVHLDLLATHGRMVHLATMRGATAELNIRQLMRKQLRLIGFQLRLRSPEQKARACQHLWQRFGAAFHDGRIEPLICARFPLAEAQQAHDLLAQNQHVGKIILLVCDAV